MKLRMANFVFSAAATLMTLDKSLAVSGITMQAGSNQHVCDLIASALHSQNKELKNRHIIPRDLVERSIVGRFN